MSELNTSRRSFLRGMGAMSLGSAAYSLMLPKGSWAASVAEASYRRSMAAMGTIVNISVIGESEARSREAIRDAFEEIRWVDYLMSTHRQFSELSRVNRAAGSESFAVNARTREVVAASLEWSRISGGLFDVTTLPLMKAYGFRGEEAAREQTAEEARERVGYKHIAFEGEALGLTKKGAEMDLGGIAKGYAVDRAAHLLRDKWGIENAIVEAGGDLYVLGCPADAPGWKIGISDPRRPGANCATLELANMAAATSGKYETRRTISGEECADIFNPATGQPLGTFMSTTTLAATCMDADAATKPIWAAKGAEAAALLKPGVAWLNIAGPAGGELEFRPSANFAAFERV